MQYAIKTSPQYTTYADMLAVWQAADQMDIWHSAWTFDHFYPINVPDTTGPCLEGWMTLAGLAQATSRIRVGCMVTGVVYRHPAVLANMASTLDVMSDGRLELGQDAVGSEVIQLRLKRRGVNQRPLDGAIAAWRGDCRSWPASCWCSRCPASDCPA